MKIKSILFLCLLSGSAFAEQINVPNLGKTVTGTAGGAGHTALDVNLTGGSVTATNPSVGATGAAVPASGTYAAGNKAGNLTGLLIGQQTMANSLGVVLASDQAAIPVSQSGAWTFGRTWSLSSGSDSVSAVQSGTWNLTNISGTISLPTGASTSAKQPALGTAGTASTDVITVQGIASMTALKVDGSGVTQPVSAASLPLPAGAATAAKQPALGTAGSASADVISVQGVASMTALKVDNSAVTQPDNLTQIAGNAVSAGNGTSGTGVLRVTVASDSTGQIKLAAGANLAGSFSIDQTTPGTTNLVSIGTNGTVTAKLQDGSGSAVNKGQTTMSGSLPVTIASDQVAPKTYVNSAGSFVLNSSLTTVISESAPSGAVGFILEAKDSNSANIRWAIGATATTTSGMQLQPGRDTGFVPVGATVSVVAESGTLEYQLTWIKQ